MMLGGGSEPHTPEGNSLYITIILLLTFGIVFNNLHEIFDPLLYNRIYVRSFCPTV